MLFWTYLRSRKFLEADGSKENELLVIVFVSVHENSARGCIYVDPK